MDKKSQNQTNFNKKNNERGLGKGVDALFLNTDNEVDVTKIVKLPLTSIIPSRFQARKVFDENAIFELSQSILENGIIQPILVRHNPNQNNYELIAGERRWRAAKIANIKNIPAIIKNSSDKEVMLLGLIENLQRENLSCIDEAEGINTLINNYQLTHEAAGKLINKSRSVVSNSLRLLELDDDIKTLIRDGLLDMGHARALLSIDKSQQKLVANDIVNKKLTVRDVENFSKVKNVVEKNIPQCIDNINIELQQLLEEVEDKIGLKLTCEFRKNGGKDVESGVIKINFSTIEQFNFILKLLKQ